MACSPVSEPAEAEFGPPAKPPSDRSEAKLKHATWACLRADMIDEHDLAAGPDYPCEFVKGGFRFGHRSNDELSDDDVEGPIRQRHPFGIHNRQCLDVAEPALSDALVRLA